MTAVILAAGRGSRIWPYGETQPKAALPIANRPLIDWQLEALAALGPERIVTVVGHLEGQVRAALADRPAVELVRHVSPVGTATALIDALDTLGDEPEPLLVLYGDVLLTADSLLALRDALDAAPDAVAAALVAPLDGPAGDWLCAKVDGHALTAVAGHPRGASHRLGGAYLLRREALSMVRANPGRGVRVSVGGMPHLEFDLEESLGMLLDRGQVVLAVAAAGPYVDLDKPWHLLQANRVGAGLLFAGATESRLDGCDIDPSADLEALVIAEPGTHIGPRCRVRGRLYLAAGAELDHGAMCDGTNVLGSNAYAGHYCHLDGAIVGRRCCIEHGAQVSGVIMDGCYLVHQMLFTGVLGRDSDLGAATVCGGLRFDDRATWHLVKGRRELPTSGANEVYLGDYTRTGVNAILMPGVKVGPYSLVGAGVVLSEDLPARTRRLVRQEYDDQPWGPERYGW